MKRLHIIKAGSTFPDAARRWGDMDAWIVRGLGVDCDDVCVVDAEHGGTLPDPGASCGVIVTGSQAMVTDNLPWSLALEAWIPPVVEAGVPFLGICYGHQLLARALGGGVGFHPGGREMGTVDVRLLPACSGDLLFGSLPTPFKAHVSHAQTVLELPQGAVRLACNAFEPTHAFRFGARAWGVQFHPEFDAEIMKCHIEKRAGELTKAGLSVPDLVRGVEDAPVAALLLGRFACLAACNVRSAGSRMG